MRFDRIVAGSNFPLIHRGIELLPIRRDQEVSFINDSLGAAIRPVLANVTEAEPFVDGNALGARAENRVRASATRGVSKRRARRRCRSRDRDAIRASRCPTARPSIRFANTRCPTHRRHRPSRRIVRCPGRAMTPAADASTATSRVTLRMPRRPDRGRHPNRQDRRTMRTLSSGSVARGLAGVSVSSRNAGSSSSIAHSRARNCASIGWPASPSTSTPHPCSQWEKNSRATGSKSSSRGASGCNTDAKLKPGPGRLLVVNATPFHFSEPSTLGSASDTAVRTDTEPRGRSRDVGRVASWRHGHRVMSFGFTPVLPTRWNTRRSPRSA